MSNGVSPEERARRLAEMEKLLAPPAPLSEHSFVKLAQEKLGALTLIKVSEPKT
jgi:hypothetical protein